MRKNLIFFFFLFISGSEIFAQPQPIDSLDHSNYIINASSYKKGVYKTFKEFKYNGPSITSEFLFDGKRLWLIDGEGKKKKIYQKDIWGFSDGSKLFISWHKYNEITEKGRYCTFKEKRIRPMFLMSAFPPMPLIIPVPLSSKYIINLNTGKVYILSKKLIKIIFTKDDPQLYKEFLGETGKKRKLFEYIEKYNDRNKDKIK